MVKTPSEFMKANEFIVSPGKVVEPFNVELWEVNCVLEIPVPTNCHPEVIIHAVEVLNAGAASERINVFAVPFTAAEPITAVGLAPVEVEYPARIVEVAAWVKVTVPAPFVVIDINGPEVANVNGEEAVVPCAVIVAVGAEAVRNDPRFKDEEENEYVILFAPSETIEINAGPEVANTNGAVEVTPCAEIVEDGEPNAPETAILIPPELVAIDMFVPAVRYPGA